MTGCTYSPSNPNDAGIVRVVGVPTSPANPTDRATAAAGRCRVGAELCSSVGRRSPPSALLWLGGLELDEDRDRTCAAHADLPDERLVMTRRR
jgi:hypothetical protein